MGAFYWTTVQCLNYTLIPERNRVPVVSLFGLIWTTFLAYMKQKPTQHPHIEYKEEKMQYLERSAPIIP